MEHVVIGLAAAAVWAAFVFVSPTRACGACARYRGPCPRCKGTGRRWRLGARLVHRGAVKALRRRRGGR